MPELCRTEDIPEETGIDLMIESSNGAACVALFVVNGQVRAYWNRCPHQGRNLNWAQNEFLLEPDGKLVCPHHGATFDLVSGECVQGPCKGEFLQACKIVVSDGKVLLESNDQE